MRLIRFTVLAACILVVLPSLAQTSQPQSSQSPATQAAPFRQPSPGPDTGLIRNPLLQQPGTSSAQSQAEDALQKRADAQMQEAYQQFLAQRRSGKTTLIPWDPGIYAQSDSNICGTIVSYNFSQGNNPHLENITTCTPSKGFVTRYVEGDHGKAPIPGVVRTKLVQTK